MRRVFLKIPKFSSLPEQGNAEGGMTIAPRASADVNAEYEQRKPPGNWDLPGGFLVSGKNSK
jgi:hypothetical protein